MRIFYTLWRRELKAYFFSPLAYITSVVLLLVMGLGFWTVISALAHGPAHAGVLQLLIGDSLFFWIAMLVVIPVITMRLISEEKRSGTFESLLTAPLSDTWVVLSKYVAAWSVYILIWMPTLAYPWLLSHFSNQTVPIDIGVLVSSYVGILLIGSCYLAVGLLCSALTRSQAVAALVTLATLCVFFFAGFAYDFARDPALQAWGRYISPVIHMNEFSRGVVDTRALVFYLSLTAWLLFATVKVVEVRKWQT